MTKRGVPAVGGPWRNRIVGYSEEPVDSLLANPSNWRIHGKPQQEALAGVLREVGLVQNVLVNKASGHVVDGHLRITLAMRDGQPTVPVTWVDLTETEEAEVLATLDPISAMASADAEKLDALLREVQSGEEGVQAMLAELAKEAHLYADGHEADGDKQQRQEVARKSLAERFIVPPFSVLDARQGYWQERKRAWIALGLKPELGRTDNAMHRGETGIYTGWKTWEETKGQKAKRRGLVADQGAGSVYAAGSKWAGYRGPQQEGETQTGTSLMDPVLCECVYRWFCPPGGLVVNPMAGESSYGIVAGYLGYRYVGVELRPEQVAANQEQAEAIGVPAVWIEGDGRDVGKYVTEPVDFVFSCPPYADLEVYSDDPRDLSTMEYPEFVAVYREIIAKSVALLRPDRFACFVVGEVRHKRGAYLNFVADTIAAFRDAGAAYYNEAILVTPPGSLPVRVARQFPTGRKLGKTHQNVLVFVKGDWKRAVEACGEVDVSLPEGFGDAG